MIFFYKLLSNFLYFTFYPFILLQAVRGKQGFGERVVFKKPAPADLWIHAASVGETRLISYLIYYLLEKSPGLKIHLTVITPAGYDFARDLYGESIRISYMPLDIKGPLRRFFKSLEPKLVLMAEVEIWPRLILECERQKLPLVQVNGRMSEKSHRRYGKLKAGMTRLFSCYDFIFLRSEQDVLYYQDFMPAPERMRNIGDLKFDAPLPERVPGEIAAIRKKLGVGDNDFVFTAGSTRKGEEEHFAELALLFRNSERKARLVLAPRHINRREEVIKILEERGVSFAVYEGEGRPEEVELILVDKIGVLNELFMASDFAFVGGTMVDTGGHNVLEPVWNGTPVCFGPDTRNVPDSAEYILSNDYGQQVHDGKELQDLVLSCLAGERSFPRKSKEEERESASKIAGDYVLERIGAGS